MKLLVEEYPYRSELAQKILNQFEPKETRNGFSSDYVGYCFSKELQDCVFFLPKVILDTKDKAFDTFSPEDIIDVENSSLNDDQKLFLNGLSVWIYRALKEYSTKQEDTSILKSQSFSEVSTGEHVDGTYLDVILSLIKFYNENRDFFIYTLRNIHSQQHKINWQKTISRTQAIIQDNTPVYIDPISKKKDINWDEELLVIFFSILNYINRYGFSITVEYNYNLIVGDLFQAYIDGLGTRRLRQIKYKYFSDKTRQLWNLCYTFFRKAEEMSSSKNDSDFLMAPNFHVVFEAMVDELLGDPSYDDWKKIGDGKIIDHIYKYKSLFSDDDTFYIGDSKYYQTKRSVEERSESALKQFTYARSIVNNSIKQSIGNTWPYRDPLTEGYSVTPNFFISAETDPELRYDVDGLDREDLHGAAFMSRQFTNRLFDRDTLWVRQYNLNFLYLISVFAAAEDGSKSQFRKRAHKFFRDQTINLLNERYLFWELEPKNGADLDEILKDNLKWALRGMAYRMGRKSNKLILAMEIPDKDAEDPFALDNNFRISEDAKRLKKIVPELFIQRPCRLSKKDGEFVEYVPVPSDSHHGFFFFFFDECQTD